MPKRRFMDEPVHSESTPAPTAAAADIDALLAALRTAGAQQFDPLRLHYIEVLARRAIAHEGSVRRMLDAKLRQALAAFKECFDQAQSAAQTAIAHSAQDNPQEADELQQLLSAADFKGVRRLVASLASPEPDTSLGALVRRLEQHAPGNTDPHAGGNVRPRAELKTLRNSRNTWSKLSADKQVSQALEQAPKNAGPINSHMLVLRSLALMRDISPDYLNRFMTYADTLLCLDQCEKEKPGNPKKPAPTRAAKK